MIKKVFCCDGDGCKCHGGNLYVAADREELKQQLSPCCIECDRYEEIETVSAKDGEYVIIAVKIDPLVKALSSMGRDYSVK